MKLFYILLSSLSFVTANYTRQCTLVQDKGRFSRFSVMNFVNNERLIVAKALDAVDMYNMTWDVSLQQLAERAMIFCDSEPFEDGEHRKIRMQLSEDGYGMCLDFVESRDDFIEHIRRNGTSFANMTSEFEAHYNLFYAEQKKIGCSFKVCADFDSHIFNLLCYFWPKKTLEGSFIKTGNKKKCGDGLCGPKRETFRSNDRFRKVMLKTINNARRGFAKKIPVGNMYRMEWNETLAENAQKAASKCYRKIVKSPTRTTIGMLPLVSANFFGKQTGASYEDGRINEEKRSIRIWKDTQFWWNHREIGCAQSKENCPVEVFCTISHPSTPSVKMYEKGKVCSICKDGCDDGLCYDTEKGMASSASDSKISVIFWNLMLIVATLSL